MKRFILIDAHAVIHRAYHAIPPLTAPSGEVVHAVYGFTSILLRILRELKPDYIAAAFDMPGPTFRHIAYERYKAQRPAAPSDLISQFALVKEVLASMQISIFQKSGFEADDIIGTIVEKLKSEKQLEIIIVTGDMDMLQLVRPRVKVYTPKKGISETVIYDEKEVMARFGFKPEQMIDYKGLRGDPSDNIPGVKGVGEKTATELIKKFGSIEKIYKALKNGSRRSPQDGTKEISSSIAAKLSEGEEDARFSRALATIRTNVPIKFDLPATHWQEGAGARDVVVLFQKLGFHTLLKRMSSATVEKASVALQALPGMEPTTTGLTSGLNTAKEIVKKQDWDAFAKTAEREEQIGIIFFSPSLKNAKKQGIEKESMVRHTHHKKEAVFFILPSTKKVYSCSNRTMMNPLFFEKKRQWVSHDAKKLLHYFSKSNVVLHTIEFDMMLAAYLVGDLSRNFSYLAIAARELGRLVSENETEEYQHFFDIAVLLKQKLKERNLGRVFSEIELPLISVLKKMEERGVLLDSSYLAKLSRELDSDLSGITKKIYKHAREEFNINSSQQLSVILFEKLGIKTQGLRKTEKGGVISTGASELEKLRKDHPIISQILDYRELMKLKTTYVDVLPLLVNSATGRLHTTFHQTGTATGRLSSSDPNLQNIPIMSEYGKKVRRAFIAKNKYLLVSLDYSQIELRVSAELAGDEKMIAAFREGKDIHALTAAEVYNVSYDKVTPDLRRAAKTLNFGILYGMGSQALSDSTGMSREEAKRFIEEYFKDFSQVASYIASVKQFAQDHGYVENFFGRRRYIPEIYSPNWQLKREAERMAVNMPIQGTAADVVKKAMIAVDQWVGDEKKEDEGEMLLQVHDELLFEIKKEKAKEFGTELKNIMEHVVSFRVPLVVDVKIGPNWEEMNLVRSALPLTSNEE